MSELVITRDYLEFLWQLGPVPSAVSKDSRLEYFEDELSTAITPGWILAPDLLGIPECVYRIWFERAILVERCVVPVAPGPNPLDVGERTILVKSPEGPKKIDLLPWLFDYDNFHYEKNTSICKVDRVCLLRNLPQY